MSTSKLKWPSLNGHPWLWFCWLTPALCVWLHDPSSETVADFCRHLMGKSSNNLVFGAWWWWCSSIMIIGPLLLQFNQTIHGGPFSDVLDESDEHFCASTILRTINKEQLATTALFSVFFCCKKGFGFVTTIFLLPTLQTLVRVCMSCARRTLVVFGVFCLFLWMLHDDGPKKEFWYEMKILIAWRRHMQSFYKYEWKCCLKNMKTFVIIMYTPEFYLNK